MKAYLGRVYRDVGRKIEGHVDLEARFARLLGLVERLLAQKPDDSNKLYSLHAPEVVCISKGKARHPYEFGCNVGLAATNREGLFIAANAFEGNPYDGHTLNATAENAETMTGVSIERIYVDKGYRGHDYDGKALSDDARFRRSARDSFWQYMFGLLPTVRVLPVVPRVRLGMVGRIWEELEEHHFADCVKAS